MSGTRARHVVPAAELQHERLVRWGAGYHGLAVAALCRGGGDVDDAVLAYIWPTCHENVHFCGTHSVDAAGELAELGSGGYRPLRTPGPAIATEAGDRGPGTPVVPHVLPTALCCRGRRACRSGCPLLEAGEQFSGHLDTGGEERPAPDGVTPAPVPPGTSSLAGESGATVVLNAGPVAVIRVLSQRARQAPGPGPGPGGSIAA
jgi:hypothetical protein